MRDPYLIYQSDMKTKAGLVKAQWDKYGPEFINLLMEEYDFTNKNLLNDGVKFSWDIINQVYLSLIN